MSDHASANSNARPFAAAVLMATGALVASGLAGPRDVPGREARALATDSLTLEDIEGHWMGALEVGTDQAPRLGVRILRKADGSMGASSASLDQGVDFIPSTVTLEGRTLTVRMSDPGVTVEGEIGPDRRRINAVFHQGDAELPITLERVEELPPAGEIRPQTPRPPYPYAAEDVRFQNEADGAWLAGTLTKPEGPGPHPAAIVLPGSGPQDRGMPGTGGHEPQAVIADDLTKRGFAVLRYDKRGVYESTGSYGDATDEDFARDAVAAYRYLTARDDVDPGRTGFVGHSQGSLLAARAAAWTEGDVGFIVSMAGTGLPLFDLLVLQDGTQAAAEGATEREVELIRDFSRRYYRTAMETGGAAARKEALAAAYDSLAGEQRRAMEEYFGDRPGTLDPSYAARDAFVEDLKAEPPAHHWKQVSAPVLVLNGGRDSQVPAEENVSAIVEALEEAPTDRFESEIFPDRNHMFQTAETGAVDEYDRIEQTIDPDVLHYIGDWLEEVAVDDDSG